MPPLPPRSLDPNPVSKDLSEVVRASSLPCRGRLAVLSSWDASTKGAERVLGVSGFPHSMASKIFSLFQL